MKPGYMTHICRWDTAIERDGDDIENQGHEPVMYRRIFMYMFDCVPYFLYNKTNCITF